MNKWLERLRTKDLKAESLQMSPNETVSCDLKLKSGRLEPKSFQKRTGKSRQDLRELFEQAVAELAILDPRGVSLRQIQQDPQTWARAQAAEDEVNELWKQAQGGRMVWEEYRSAVRKWKDKLIQAIEAQKGRK